MILLSARGVELEFIVMTINEFSCDRPKIAFASSPYHDESCREVEEDPSDSPGRFPSSPRAGLSRIKVDVLRS